MAFRIWLDDIRPAPTGYIHCYSVNETKGQILAAEEIGITDFLLDLDHDLGLFAKDGGDGIKLIDWLDETGRHYNVQLHTQNVVGRQNMQRIINRW